MTFLRGYSAVILNCVTMETPILYDTLFQNAPHLLLESNRHIPIQVKLSNNVLGLVIFASF